MNLTRRTLIASAGAGVTSAAALSVANGVDLGLPGGPSFRPLTPRFPQKGEMIVQRVRPPLLETPFEVFKTGTITPNDRHFVRWHYDVPTDIDVTKFRLVVRGAVRSPLSLALQEVIRAGEHVEFVAVNQCAGNGRGLQEPRVIGAQWAHGAMSNARWRGVRLRDVLDKAGVGADAKFVRFKGLDTPQMPGAPHFMKSIPVDVARRDDTMVAFAMNGEALPILNGFPLRLVVPGWFSTHWVKMLTDIEVLTAEDDNFWMAKAYRWPTVPVKPGDKDFPTVPIGPMPPRSWITSHVDKAVVRVGEMIDGIAMGGDSGVAKVELIVAPTVGTVGRPNDAIQTIVAQLGPDEGPYGFRRWSAPMPTKALAPILSVRCTNTKGVAQPDTLVWNPSGYARSVVESITATI
jgi:DMSO/TMAO reductase YedYZ molybdopterin-dependent catalytic subunit